METPSPSPNAHWVRLVEKLADHRTEWMILAGELMHLLKTPNKVALNEEGQIALSALKEQYMALTAKVGCLEPATNHADPATV